MTERVILPIIDAATQLVPHAACMISAATSYVEKGPMTLSIIMERYAFLKDEIERSEAAGLDAPAQTGLDATRRWHRQFDARMRVGNIPAILLSARDTILDLTLN